MRFEGKICTAEAGNELNEFKAVNESNISYLYARDECEKYCRNNIDCWGCTFNCDNDCMWMAVSECKEIGSDGLGVGGITQKPGNFDLKCFYICIMIIISQNDIIMLYAFSLFITFSLF